MSPKSDAAQQSSEGPQHRAHDEREQNGEDDDPQFADDPSDDPQGCGCNEDYGRPFGDPETTCSEQGVAAATGGGVLCHEGPFVFELVRIPQ